MALCTDVGVKLGIYSHRWASCLEHLVQYVCTRYVAVGLQPQPYESRQIDSVNTEAGVLWFEGGSQRIYWLKLCLFWVGQASGNRVS